MNDVASEQSWKRVRLGEIAKTASGGTPKRTVATYYGGGIPWVKSGELGDSTVYQTEETISKAGLNASSAKVFPKGTLCVALYGATVGKLGILGLDAATNQAVCGIFLPESIDTRFAYRFLESRRRDLVDLGKGGAQSNISQEIIRDLEFPIPPIDEQREIVAEIEKQFTRLEAGVAGLRRVQANLKRYRAAVLKAACEGKLVPTDAEFARQEGRSYETGAELLERVLTKRREKWSGKGKYKEPAKPDIENLPKLAEGWAWGTATQIFMEVKDGTHDTPKYQRSGIPFITQRHIKPSGLVFDDYNLISKQDHDHYYERSNPVRGDILVSMIGVNRGQSCIVTTDEIFSIKNVGLFKPYHLFSNVKFLQNYLSSLLGQKLILETSKGGAQPFIGLTELRRWPIPFPPLVEQQRIVAEVERRLSVVEELEAVVKANLQRSTRLRQSILLCAFSER